MRSWPTRRWLVVAVTTPAAAVLMGVPTGIVHTFFYRRMTPVLWWNYPVWAISAVLIGLTIATYTSRVGPSGSTPVTGGVLSTLAIGCPVCNKLVVAAVGVNGALRIWAPVQPWLGVGSVVLLAYALRRRLRADQACPVPVGR